MSVTSRLRSTLSRILQVGVGVVLLLVLAGCPEARSRVHGTVKHQGKPLTSGTIVFLPSDNQSYPAQIQADGSYEVPSLPRGPVRAVVQVEAPRPVPRPDPPLKGGDNFGKQSALEDDRGKRSRLPQAPPPGLQLPEKYSDPGKSGLRFDLTEPDQEFSVDLP